MSVRFALALPPVRWTVPARPGPDECGCARFPPVAPPLLPGPARAGGAASAPGLSEHSRRFEAVAGAAWVCLHLMAAQAPNEAEGGETQSFPKVTFLAPGLPRLSPDFIMVRAHQ